jgi:hypothetical protein
VLKPLVMQLMEALQKARARLERQEHPMPLLLKRGHRRAAVVREHEREVRSAAGRVVRPPGGRGGACREPSPRAPRPGGSAEAAGFQES